MAFTFWHQCGEVWQILMIYSNQFILKEYDGFMMQLWMSCGGGGEGGVGRQCMGWGFDCLCWPWGRAFDWSCSRGGGDVWIFLRPTWRYLTSDSDEKDWDWTLCFLLPRFMHVPHGLENLEIIEANGNKRKLSGFHCLSSNFLCFSIFWIDWTS